MSSTISHLRSFSLTLAAGLLSIAGTARADQVINDDLIVQNSACIGNHCVNGENLTAMALKLKETTIRVVFEDTSTAAGFASNDWRIDVNTSTVNKFSILDLTGSFTPFTIEAGARTNALYVENDGHIGIGTSNPEVNLQIVAGNTPTLRLEKDGSNGFSPYIWDVAGNESGFFIRDETGSGTLPFRIRPDAPNNSNIIQINGDLALGTGSPDAPLHIKRTDGTARIHVQETSATQAARELLLIENFGGSYFTLKNTKSGRDWFFKHENAADGRFVITSSTNPSQGLFLSPTGNLQIGGVLTQNSDRNAKMAIEPVDAHEILAKLTTLPVSAWTYIDDTSGARHVGPMAQDFHALFGLGETETGISTLDTSGVALAAIKALAEENAALKEQNDSHSALIADLAVCDVDQKALIADFAARLQNLESLSEAHMPQ